MYICQPQDVFLLLLRSVAHCVLSSCGVFISSDISYHSCPVILGFLLHFWGLKLQGPDIWLLTTHTLSCQDPYLLRLTFLRLCVFQPIWTKSEKSGWCFSQPVFTLENHLLPSSVRVRPCLVSTHTHTQPDDVLRSCNLLKYKTLTNVKDWPRWAYAFHQNGFLLYFKFWAPLWAKVRGWAEKQEVRECTVD